MSDKAIVTKIITDNLAKVAKLPEKRPHNDKDCVNCGGCGKTTEMIETTALNLVGAKLGDVVFIESDEKKSIWLMVILIVGPILIPLTFYMIAASVGFPGVIGGIAAAFGLFLAYRIIKYYNNKVANEAPITRIVGIQEQETRVQI